MRYFCFLLICFTVISCEQKLELQQELDFLGYEFAKQNLTRQEQKIAIQNMESSGSISKGMFYWSVDFTLKNNNILTVVKDVEITAQFYSKTESLMYEKKYTCYEILTPGSQKMFSFDLPKDKNISTFTFKITNLKF